MTGSRGVGSSEAAPAPPLPRRVVVLATTVLLASFVLNAMDRQVFSPLLPDIRAELGFSLSEAGLLATGFTLGMAIAGIPAEYLVDRLSRKTILLLSILIYSAGNLATAFAAGFLDMAVYRVLSGLGEGVQATALFAALCSFFHRRRALAAGAIGAAFGIGVFLGPLIGIRIADWAGDWRPPFIVFGVAGVAVVLAIAIAAPRKFTDAVGISPTVQSRPTFDHVPVGPYNKNIWALAVTSAIGGLVFYGFLGLYPTFLRDELAFAPGQAALAISFVGAGSITSIFAGWVGDRVDQRRLLLMTFIAVAVVSWFVFHGPTTPGVHYLLSFLMGIFASAFLYTNCNAAMQRSVRPDQVGRATGTFMASYYIAAAFSGLLLARLVGAVGWVTAGTLQFVLLPLLALLVLAVVDPSKFTTARVPTTPVPSGGRA